MPRDNYNYGQYEYEPRVENTQDFNDWGSPIKRDYEKDKSKSRYDRKRKYSTNQRHDKHW